MIYEVIDKDTFLDCMLDIQSLCEGDSHYDTIILLLDKCFTSLRDSEDVKQGMLKVSLVSLLLTKTFKSLVSYDKIVNSMFKKYARAWLGYRDYINGYPLGVTHDTEVDYE